MLGVYRCQFQTTQHFFNAPDTFNRIRWYQYYKFNCFLKRHTDMTSKSIVTRRVRLFFKVPVLLIIALNWAIKSKQFADPTH